MQAIETVATVAEDGTITAQGPPSLPGGEHRVVIVVDETPVPEEPIRFPGLPSTEGGAPDAEGSRQAALAAIERSFRELRVEVGQRTWTREDLHER